MHFEWGKLSRCHLKGKTFLKWTNALNVYDSENKCTPGAGLPLPWGNIRGLSQKFHYTHCFATIKARQRLQHLWSPSTIYLRALSANFRTATCIC